jgi:hypothetical protein
MLKPSREMSLLVTVIVLAVRGASPEIDRFVLAGGRISSASVDARLRAVGVFPRD